MRFKLDENLGRLLTGSQRVKLRRASLEDLFLIKLGDRGHLLTKDANADYGNSTAVFLSCRDWPLQPESLYRSPR